MKNQIKLQSHFNNSISIKKKKTNYSNLVLLPLIINKSTFQTANILVMKSTSTVKMYHINIQ
jgi:hypothetical protein